MKHFLVAALLLSFVLQSKGVLAQTFSTQNTSSAASTATDSNTRAFNILLRQQMRKVRKDFAAGTLTRDQVKAKLSNLRSVRGQELEFFRRNGAKKLTDGQKSQLEQLVAQN